MIVPVKMPGGYVSNHRLAQRLGMASSGSPAFRQLFERLTAQVTDKTPRNADGSFTVSATGTPGGPSVTLGYFSRIGSTNWYVAEHSVALLEQLYGAHGERRYEFQEMIRQEREQARQRSFKPMPPGPARG